MTHTHKSKKYNGYYCKNTLATLISPGKHIEPIHDSDVENTCDLSDKTSNSNSDKIPVTMANISEHRDEQAQPNWREYNNQFISIYNNL